MIRHRNGSNRRQRSIQLATWLGLTLAPGVTLSSRAAITPVFRNNNAGAPNGSSVLIGTHDLDANTSSPGDFSSNMPSAGIIPVSAVLLAPYSGSGHNMSVAGGSSNAKGGAGHTEGSNLAKITFPSGTGIDQSDPAPHDVGPSVFTQAFNFRWDLPPNASPFGATAGTFSMPIGAKIGTGSGAFAKLEYDIKWDKIVNGVTTPARSSFKGSITFPSSAYPGSGPWLTSITAPSVTIPSISAANNDDLIVMHGSIRFISNNEDGESVAEVMGEGTGIPPSVSPLLRSNIDFINLWNAHPEHHYESGAGFEEPIVQPHLFWDTDGPVPGAGGGTAPTGNWDGATANFTNDPNGAGPTQPTTSNNDVVVFSAGNNATGVYNVFVQGTRQAAKVQAEEGSVALIGGALACGVYDAPAGATVFSSSAVLGGPTGSVAKQGDGLLTLVGTYAYTGGTIVESGTLRVTRLHEENGVTIHAGATLQILASSPTLPGHPAGNDAFVSRPSTLLIANDGAEFGSREYFATLDLGNNDLIIDYDVNSPAAEIEDMIRSGYNGGNWLGKGITSSVAASIDAAGAYTLGVIDNATVGITAFATFSGQTVDTTTVLVKFIHRSDLNMDGVVDFSDSVRFNNNFSEGTPTRWVFGDLNYNGVSDFGDSVRFNGGYDEALTSLPEPGTLAVFGLAGIGLMRRRGPVRYLPNRSE